MTIPAEFVQQRQQKLASALSAAGLDALALNPSESLIYLTGLHFHLSERPVVGIFFPEADPWIVLPELESAKLAGLAYPLQATTYGEDPASWPQRYADALSGSAALKIGLEDNAMRLLEYRLLKSALPKAKFIDATDVLAGLRMYKDSIEVAAMQKAAEIAETALSAAIAQIKIGMTELEVAGILIQELFKAGSGGELPFQPIVSTGPNGANPHAVPSERPLQHGDLLVIDFGASVDGYFSDITRTFALGKYSPEQAHVYNAVLSANQAGHAAAAPGAACQDVDRAARKVIEDAGYGEYFIHRTGHGLGMQAHEAPYIRSNNPQPLEPGMTFTIEPGIYLPERFGVRIEDDVLVTPNGLRSLTTFPRELQVIGDK
ncbi:MAG: aminopeptidase P family protein [Anaerolineales bacterium]|nr:aminopeptidase P family protein [Anaerolineales bacterium]